jgi:aminomethyltransferase
MSGPTSGPATAESDAEDASALKRTPLYEAHRRLGARMVPFAGWEMPVQYASILDEHRTVRNAVGLFDLSHMGELFVSGPDALGFVSHAVISNPASLAPGQAQYSMMVTPEGGIIDDLIIYRIDEGYLIVCNAANRDADVAHLRDVLAAGGFDASLDDRSDGTGLVAPQGPRAADLLRALTDADIDGLGYYHATRATVAGIDCLIARTGYTGEDGFELLCDAAETERLWEAVLAAGGDYGIQPCGLGSRDTLRLEAGMPLYGNELDREHNPIEAGMGRLVKLDKGEFVGRGALAHVKATGPIRRLVGLVMRDNAIARHGYPVHSSAGEGVVTSGTASPTLNEKIAMAYVPTTVADRHEEVEVLVRERPYRAEQVKLPFYRRPAE